ncbi:MAG TPA: DUF4388 domain-containing protein [Candidatus Polarisedimenticolaceae bacterium]|nr:DUF4388 domain-containing protein [Candidatus Polarisedimenticolaceae bacterium]
MALQGTLKDFGLGDIFQLIGIQRKTGILALDNGDDSVTVKFLEGQVVGADTKRRSVEELLGSVLVRTGRISQSQLQDALKRQKRTLQRLGYVLVQSGLISEDDLIEALRVQSLQIIYRLFRWRDGSYSFRGVEDLEYDEKHFIPISAETILMEGARMIDEWPIIERRIKSDRIVLRATDAAASLGLTVEAIVDRDIGIDPNHGAEGGVRLSREEREVLGLVDGRRTVEEINGFSTLGEFDTYRVLSELMTRNLIEEVKRVPVRPVGGIHVRRLGDRLFRWTLDLIVLGVVVAGVASLRANPWVPWRIDSLRATTEQLRLHASQARLEHLESAIQVYYLDRGVFPQSLELLAANRYVRPGETRDPWGRPYGFRLSASGYQLYGWDGAGELRPNLTLARRFTAIQRMMSGLAEAEPSANE